MADPIRTVAYADDDNDRIIIAREQHVGAIVDDCKARHNEGFHENGLGKHVARVPNVVVEHYCNVNKVPFAEFVRNPEHMRRLVNDPAFADLRIWHGTI